MDNKEYHINELIIRLIENQISEKDFNTLCEFLRKTPESVEYYCEFINDYVSVKTEVESEIAHISKQSGDVLLDWDFWQSIAEYERTAEPVEETKSDREPAQIDISRQSPSLPLRKPSRIPLYTAVAAAAAMFVMIVYVLLVPKPLVGEVATLTDMIGVQWGEGQHYEMGERFYLNYGPIFLKTGIVKIEYDEHVQVTIEGPARFEINSPTTIKLDSGRLYTHVFEYGRGFTVDTKNSRIIDLGTEFGVEAVQDSFTELHVFKGKTTLVAFDSNHHKNISDQTAGQAVRISDYYSDLKIREIPLKINAFVRDICSATQVIWKGEKQISLADIVGGGNGLGTGLLGSGWNPATGKYVRQVDVYEWLKSQNTYSVVSSHPFIDGVFVPDGGEGPVVLNSKSQQYEGFEDTTGVYRFEITNGPAIWKRAQLPDSKIPVWEFYMQDLKLNGIPCGTAENPGIYMHSNSGITFNLSAIRNSFPAGDISAFSTICGKPDQVKEQITTVSSSISVYIFIDGKCSFKRELLTRTDAPKSVSIPIRPDNEFLTLVVVDVDQDPGYDWCLFANPVLEFSSR